MITVSKSYLVRSKFEQTLLTSGSTRKTFQDSTGIHAQNLSVWLMRRSALSHKSVEKFLEFFKCGFEDLFEVVLDHRDTGRETRYENSGKPINKTCENCGAPLKYNSDNFHWRQDCYMCMDCYRDQIDLYEGLMV